MVLSSVCLFYQFTNIKVEFELEAEAHIVKTTALASVGRTKACAIFLKKNMNKSVDAIKFISIKYEIIFLSLTRLT